MVSLDGQDVKSEDDIQGNTRPEEGRYHVVVKDVDESFEKFDKIIIEFEVLAGTTPGQEGRTLSEFFAVTEKAIPRLKRFALCVGLVKPGDPERDVSFLDAVGRDLVIEVVKKKGKDDKEYSNVDYMGMWSTGNEAVADVPKLALANQQATQQTTQSQQARQQTAAEQPQQSQTTQQTATKDEWSDL
jgi:hypothetical protein